MGGEEEEEIIKIAKNQRNTTFLFVLFSEGFKVFVFLIGLARKLPGVVVVHVACGRRTGHSQWWMWLNVMAL